MLGQVRDAKMVELVPHIYKHPSIISTKNRMSGSKNKSATEWFILQTPSQTAKWIRNKGWCHRF